MTPKQLETINSALKMYGAHVGQDNRITKGDLPTRIEVSIVRNRLQFIGINEDGTRGHTQASGSVSAATVSDFVESFWYWEQKFDVPCWLLLPDGRFIKGSDDNWAEDCKALYTETEHAARRMATDMGLI